ncbi:unnamed protein product [Merluccius merluccius]
MRAPCPPTSIYALLRRSGVTAQGVFFGEGLPALTVSLQRVKAPDQALNSTCDRIQGVGPALIHIKG